MDMASDGQDFVIDENSIIKKRDGFDEVNATAVSANPTIDSFASLRLSNGTVHEVFGTSNGGVWEEDSGVVTASIFTGLGTTRALEYTQFLDTLIIADSVNTIKTWDGSATGEITAAASAAKFVETHLNKLFVAGMSYATSRVDYSATGDFNTWTGSGTDQFNVEQNNGQDITGIKSYARNELIIFKENSTHKLIGFDRPSFNLLTVDKTIGCIESKTIQNFKASTGGGLLVFAYIDGLYVYDGSQINKISSYVQDIWDSINSTRYSQMVSTLDSENGRYLIAFATGSSTTNDTMLCVDLKHPWIDDNGFHFPIFKWTVSAQGLHTEIDQTTNREKIVFGGNADGFKYYFGTFYSDNGSAIDSYITTPLMAFADGISLSNNLKRITNAFVSTSGDVDIETEIKDGDEWITQETISTQGSGASLGIDFQIGVSAIGLPEATFTVNTNVRVRGRRIKVRFRQNSSTRYYNMEAPVEFYWNSAGIEK